jgi:hypothetical protein
MEESIANFSNPTSPKAVPRINLHKTEPRKFKAKNLSGAIEENKEEDDIFNEIPP